MHEDGNGDLLDSVLFAILDGAQRPLTVEELFTELDRRWPSWRLRSANVVANDTPRSGAPGPDTAAAACSSTPDLTKPLPLMVESRVGVTLRRDD
jgi:hypothetical protein